MSTLSGGVWADIAAGCPVFCTVSDENLAFVQIGEPPHQYELTFAAGPLRELISKTTAALTEMEAATRKEKPARCTCHS